MSFQSRPQKVVQFTKERYPNKPHRWILEVWSQPTGAIPVQLVEDVVEDESSYNKPLYPANLDS